MLGVGGVTLASATLPACSASAGKGNELFGSGGSPVQVGAGGATGVGGASVGTGATTGQGGMILSVGGSIGTGSTPGTFDGGKTCSVDVHAGERLPLDIYFLVDTSGSMQDKVQGGTKWSVVSSAIVSFLNDPGNADIATGIGYFPKVIPGVPPFCTVDTDCTMYGPCVGGLVSADGMTHILGNCQAADQCQTSVYSAPSVPLVLPPDHQTVVQNIGMQNPGGGTPTEPALAGAEQIAEAWSQAHPGRTTIVVLATDGEPTGCQMNAVSDVMNVAAGALSGPQKIKTYVIGVGKSLDSLNMVAQSGGSGQAFIVDTGGDVGAAFKAALDAIRGQAVPCDFKVPTMTSSGNVDPNLVNVSFTPVNATTSEKIPQTFDGTMATCAATGGWYYDNPSAPTLLHMCDASCTKLSQGGMVEVELGCQTEKAPPPR